MIVEFGHQIIRRRCTPDATRLDLGRHMLMDLHMKTLRGLLASMPNLEFIDLEHNRLHDVGALALAEGLEQGGAPALKHLLAYGNPLQSGGKGAKAIEKVCARRGIEHDLQ